MTQCIELAVADIYMQKHFDLQFAYLHTAIQFLVSACRRLKRMLFFPKPLRCSAVYIYYDYEISLMPS